MSQQRLKAALAALILILGFGCGAARAKGAVAPGTAAIVAMSGSGRNASCAMRAADPVTAVEVATPTGGEYLHLRKHLQLRATVRPETAFEGVTWRSGNPKVATVDANGRAYGRKEGAVTVYAIAKDGTGVKGAIRLRVITPVSSVKLAPEAKVFIGRSKKLAVKRSPSRASVKALAWRSSDERVAEVSADGTVTGRALGQAVITATATDGSGKSASCVLTVARPVKEISVSPENGYALVYKGEKVRLVAGVAPEDASDKSLKWSSSNRACAVVDGRGVVAGIRPGCGRGHPAGQGKDHRPGEGWERYSPKRQPRRRLAGKGHQAEQAGRGYLHKRRDRRAPLDPALGEGAAQRRQLPRAALGAY